MGANRDQRIADPQAEDGGGLLVRLLRLLAGGGLHSTVELARLLNVGETLVAAMAENLERQGYLVLLDRGCQAPCGDCSLASACGMPHESSSASRLMALTGKGFSAAAAP